MQGCPLLRWLDLEACEYLTDESALAIAKYAHNLGYLSIVMVLRITLDGMRRIVKGCTNLAQVRRPFCKIVCRYITSPLLLNTVTADGRFPDES